MGSKREQCENNSRSCRGGGGLLFCSLFDAIMLCEEAPSVDIFLSTIRSISSMYMYVIRRTREMTHLPLA